jgi:hypothetical protein
MEQWAGAAFLNAEDVIGLLDKLCVITEVKGFSYSEKYKKDNFVVKVELSNQTTRLWTMNKTSARNISKELGNDTSKWLNATLELSVQTMLVRGESKRVIIAVPILKKPETMQVSK